MGQMRSPSPYLVATDEALRASFAALETRDDVASLLEITPQLLRWILYGKKERHEYIETELEKQHGGIRRICIPSRNLRILQDKLLRILTLVYRPRPCVTGFTNGRSTLDNASGHVRKRIVVNFDLEDFFPSIHLGRIRGILQSEPFCVGPQAALAIAQIATHADGHLPQGAPTSPILANIVCGPFDTALLEFARKHRAKYTRYADDITLSMSQRRLPREIATVDDSGASHLGSELAGLVSRHGFSIRDGKTRVRHSLRRQVATGLVVNEFPNVPRRLVRSLRALIHSCTTVSPSEAARIHSQKTGRTVHGEPADWVLNVVRGQLAYVMMVRGKHDPVYRRLLRDANQIPGAKFWPETPLSQQPSQPLRRRTRRNVNWPLWVDRYQHCVFRLICLGRNEEERVGTAFRVGPHCFATAGHNHVDTRTSQTRELCLHAPLPSEVKLTRIRAVAGDVGATDLALGYASVPPSWVATSIPTQERLPQVGEEVAALGFPEISLRQPELVLHVGRVEAVTTGYKKARFISVSFASGPGLSGSPLLDANGYCVGVVVEATYRKEEDEPLRAYGQAIAIGHWRELECCGNKLTTALDAAT